MGHDESDCKLLHPLFRYDQELTSSLVQPKRVLVVLEASRSEGGHLALGEFKERLEDTEGGFLI
jgi:hypothetical protein